MPLSVTVPDGVVVVRAWGTVTTDDIVHTIRETRALFANACPPVLIDCRELAEAPSGPDLRELARSAADIPGVRECRVALVAGSDWMYGVGRAITIYAGFAGLEFEAFRAERDAQEWIIAKGADTV